MEDKKRTSSSFITYLHLIACTCVVAFEQKNKSKNRFVYVYTSLNNNKSWIFSFFWTSNQAPFFVAVRIELVGYFVLDRILCVTFWAKDKFEIFLIRIYLNKKCSIFTFLAGQTVFFYINRWDSTKKQHKQLKRKTKSKK